jgi:hypothetical protein
VNRQKNKQNDGSRFSIYTTDFNKNTENVFPNSWLYDHKRKQKKQDIKGIATGLEMQCLEWLCSLLLIFFAAK